MDIADCAELTEQTDNLAVKQTVSVACVSCDFKRGEGHVKDPAQVFTWRKRGV